MVILKKINISFWHYKLLTQSDIPISNQNIIIMESNFSINDRIFRHHLPTNIPSNNIGTQQMATANVRIIPPTPQNQAFPEFQLTRIQRKTIESLHTKYYLEYPSIPCSQCCIL